jgi:hypothetical protein
LEFGHLGRGTEDIVEGEAVIIREDLFARAALGQRRNNGV